MAHQFATLERKMVASGRDRVTHPQGTHDDLANVVCGALVRAATDARGSLVRVDRLLDGGRGVAVPVVCDRLFAVVVVDDAGQVGCVYFARCKDYGVPLTMIDFDTGPMVEGLFLSVYRRLSELSAMCRSRYPLVSVYTRPEHRTYAEREVAKAIVPVVMAEGRGAVVDVEVVGMLPEVLRPEGVARLAHLAVGPAEAGWVKLTAAVEEKMRSAPLGGELRFRSGDAVSGTLGKAGLIGIALAFENERGLKGAA